jgi:ABC-type branched-subunit amino acid transport system substrate-binding protein
MNSTHPIRIGLVTDQSGPLGPLGQANANIARLVVDDANAAGGLLGRRIELFVEDSATDDALAGAKAAKLVQQDHVDAIFGGIYSSTRLAIKASAVKQGRTLYIYPEQYEGEESDPLIFCTGPVPAQQVDTMVPWLMEHTDARRFWLPAADYIWPRVMNRRVRDAVTAHGGSIVGEAYFPVEHSDYRATVRQIMDSGAQVVFNTTVPPGVAPFLQQLNEAGFQQRGGRVVCTYMEENFASMFPAEHVEGVYGCLDYYQAVDDAFSMQLLRRYDERFPGGAKFTAGSAATGLYRGLMLWQAAVNEAGTLEQAAVLRALDHARIAQGPGGGAEMVPGQHHLRMNMYIGQVRDGRLKVVKSLGVLDPKEAQVGVPS